MNHQEVVEEDRRKKLPANFEQKRKFVEWEETEEKKRKVNLPFFAVITFIADQN